MDFLKVKTMQFPRDVIAGHGVLHVIPELISRDLKRGRVAIVSGKNTFELAGREVVKYLTDADFETEVVKIGEVTEENVSACEEQLKNKKISIVIGIGGGSKIDAAKIIAYRMKVPMVSVPTTASHDGIASPRASIKGPGVVLSQTASMPLAIVADTSIMIKAPYRYLASGAGDVISNITAILDWKLANRLNGEEYSSSAAALAEYASRELIEKAYFVAAGVEESVWLVTKQILASGTAMAIASSSRPASGSEHLFAHALELYGAGNAMHGEQCAIGSVAAMYLHGGDWQQLANTYSKIKLSIRVSDYGVSDQIAIKSLMKAHSIRPERLTILGNTDLSYSAAEKALELTGIIG